MKNIANRRGALRRRSAGLKVRTGVKAGFLDNITRHIPRGLLSYG